VLARWLRPRRDLLPCRLRPLPGRGPRASVIARATGGDLIVVLESRRLLSAAAVPSYVIAHLDPSPHARNAGIIIPDRTREGVVYRDDGPLYPLPPLHTIVTPTPGGSTGAIGNIDYS